MRPTAHRGWQPRPLEEIVTSSHQRRNGKDASPLSPGRWLSLAECRPVDMEQFRDRPAPIQWGRPTAPS
ncbi:MAG: hypothetical protein KatS3mg111_0667 [Pirellulaceae bacterium]|nr:MAG: hypothetical protein KatS3mg111_0667 [Pirellulaceae bacterium]